MKTVKKHVFRVGDPIKIKMPVIVERVGYPLNIQKVKDEHFSVEEKQKIREMLQVFGFGYADCPLLDTKPDKIYDSIVDVIARAKLKQLGWGGRERSLHLKTEESLIDKVVYIKAKKVVHTGTYVPGSGGYDYWGEYDYDPAYLSNRKTHVLLGFHSYPYNEIHSNDGTVWIEEKNVEIVKNPYE